MKFSISSVVLALCVCIICTSFTPSNSLISHSKRKNNFQSNLLAVNGGDNNAEINSPLNGIIKFVLGFKPLIGFYALMLAPVYGIGLPLWFGSMTDFNTLQNRAPPGVIANEYIVAPYDYTPARINQIAPEYNIPADQLRDEIDKVVMKKPRLRFIASDYENTKRLEYVQRTLIFRFPDVVTFQVIPIDDKKSTVAVHSYSVYGAGDLGVNANRVKTWIRDLNKDVDALVAGKK